MLIKKIYAASRECPFAAVSRSAGGALKGAPPSFSTSGLSRLRPLDRPRLTKSLQHLIHGRIQSLIKKRPERIIPAAILRQIQGGDIARPIFRTNRHGWVAAPDQHQVHQQSRRSPVAIIEGVDIDEASMGGESCFGDHRRIRKLGLFRRYACKQVIHEGIDIFPRRFRQEKR